MPSKGVGIWQTLVRNIQWSCFLQIRAENPDFTRFFFIMTWGGEVVSFFFRGPLTDRQSYANCARSSLQEKQKWLKCPGKM